MKRTDDLEPLPGLFVPIALSVTKIFGAGLEYTEMMLDGVELKVELELSRDFAGRKRRARAFATSMEFLGTTVGLVPRL